MLGNAVLGGAGIVGVGVDAVSVGRFRQLLERRPGFAGRCFTDVEQTDARSSTDRAQSLAARFAAKEAVMKALGTGLGGFAFLDVEVRRTAGTDATRHAPYLVLYGSAASLAGCARCRAIPRVVDAHGRGGDRVRGGGTGRGGDGRGPRAAVAGAAVTAVCGVSRVRAVLTREEMRAADAAALAEVSHETLVERAGTAVALAALGVLGGAYGRRVVVVAGKGSNGADGRVAAAVLARRGARVQVLEAEAVGGGRVAGV